MTGKIRRYVFLSILLLVFLSSCSRPHEQGQTTNTPVDRGDREVVIGVTVLDLANPYYAQLVDGIKKEAEARKVRVVVDDPQSDVNKQIEAVKRFTSDRVDAIIIAALDQQALEPALHLAMAEGIKVVAQATKVENCHIYVSFDEWDMGHTIGQGAGKWIKEKLGGNAEVAILNYPRIAQIAKREKGIRDGISEFAPNARIVAVESAANPEEGRAATREILNKHPGVKVVVGINDGGALGALAAFEQMGKVSSDVFIGGIDATPQAVEKIREGSVYRCTVDINPFYNGTLDVDFAVKLIKGQIVPNRYSASAKLVSKENIQDY